MRHSRNNFTIMHYLPLNIWITEFEFRFRNLIKNSGGFLTFHESGSLVKSLVFYLTVAQRKYEGTDDKDAILRLCYWPNSLGVTPNLKGVSNRKGSQTCLAIFLHSETVLKSAFTELSSWFRFGMSKLPLTFYDTCYQSGLVPGCWV